MSPYLRSRRQAHSHRQSDLFLATFPLRNFNRGRTVPSPPPLPPPPLLTSSPLTSSPLTSSLLTGIFDNVSPSAIELILQLTRTDPTERLTSKAALGHAWVTDEPTSRSKQKHSKRALSRGHTHALHLHVAADPHADPWDPAPDPAPDPVAPEGAGATCKASEATYDLGRAVQSEEVGAVEKPADDGVRKGGNSAGSEAGPAGAGEGNAGRGLI